MRPVRSCLCLLVLSLVAGFVLAEESDGLPLTSEQHVLSFYSAWNSADLDLAVSLLGTETVWKDPRLRSMPFGGRAKGGDQIRLAVLEPVSMNWQGFTVAVDSVSRNGNQVLAVGTASGFSSRTGKTLWLPYSSVWDIRDGNVRRVTTFFDAAAWLRTLQ